MQKRHSGCSVICMHDQFILQHLSQVHSWTDFHRKQTKILRNNTKKTYFGVFGDGVYKSQCGLREEGARAVCRQRRGSFDERVMGQVLHLPRRNNMRRKMKDPQKLYMWKSQVLSKLGSVRSPVWKVSHKGCRRKWPTPGSSTGCESISQV